MNRLPIERVLNALKDSTGHELVESGSGWMACCPAHDDRNPSLSVSAGNDGRVLRNCFAGCPTESVLAALGLTAGDLFPANPELTTASMSMKPQESRKRGVFHGRSTAPKPNTVTFQTSREAIESLEKRLGLPPGRITMQTAAKLARSSAGIVLTEGRPSARFVTVTMAGRLARCSNRDRCIGCRTCRNRNWSTSQKARKPLTLEWPSG